MIVETSKDILFLVIAFCILWVTIFICWILYYLLATFKRVNDVTRGIKDKLDKVGEILDLIKRKINEGATYVGMAVEALDRLFDHLKTKSSGTKKVKRLIGKIKNKKSRKQESK